ncbi:MAG: BamA/TamA family outer membrane protein [Gracilimonas sp.]|nr:BamA/TamA family outer membrane protein [Gracilimonas sp.]
MHKGIKILYLLIMCLSATKVAAQIKDPSLRGFPVVFYTEETNFAFGGLGILTFDLSSNLNSSNPSQINFGAAYTLEDQVLIYFPFELYAQDNNWRYDGEIGYYRYTYKYYGIGFNTPQANLETYKVNFPRIQFNALHKFSNGIYAGLSYWFDGYDITNIQEGGLLDLNGPTGASGGIISGIGVASVYDTRDNIFYTKDGEFAELRFLLDRNWTGSDFNFYHLTTQASTFHTNQMDHTLGFNVFGEFTGGEVPFHRLGLLGGPKQMRGYLEGRYRDHVYISVQSEYRLNIHKRIGMVVFASAGNVAPNLASFSLTNLKWSLGPGLRYRIDKDRKVNIRFDAGFGPGVSGFVLTIGEAF